MEQSDVGILAPGKADDDSLLLFVVFMFINLNFDKSQL